MMVAILVVALALGLGLPAVQTWREDGYHMHSYVCESQPGVGVQTDYPVQLSFLARYRRRMLRVGHEDCGRRQGYIEEVCPLAHPEIETPWGTYETPAQTEAIARIEGRLDELRPRQRRAFQMDGTPAGPR